MDEYKIGPGTAGLAQRIYSKYSLEDKSEGESETDLDKRMYVLKRNIVAKCGHNQY